MNNADYLAALVAKLNNPQPVNDPIFEQLFQEYIDRLDYMDYDWQTALYEMEASTR